MEDQLIIRQMTRIEVDELVDLAANEGWNPGVHDAELFWRADPEGFIAAQLGEELIGGGSIVSYDGRFGFMGFFIIKPEHRGKGLGTQLWFARRDKLQSRLAPGASIGMDGVFTMQDFYARGGFRLSHRDIRYQGVGVAAANLADHLQPLDAVSFDRLLAYDSQHFPAPRGRFLRHWIAQPDSRSLAATRNGELVGYGLIRSCREGFKIGPLFADDPQTALELFRGLSDFAAGQPVFLDVQENNPHALALVQQQGMREVFGCARMYFGPVPDLPHERIYGVTTFELG